MTDEAPKDAAPKEEVTKDDAVPDFLDYKVQRKKALEEMLQSSGVNEKENDSELFSEGFAIEKSKFGETFAANLYQCKKNGENNELMAKVIDLNAVSATIATHVREEGVRILRYLSKRKPFRYLLDIYEVFLVAKQRIVIIEETPANSLIAELSKLGKNEHWGDTQLSAIAKQLGNAINSLHNAGIAHQNIAPHNIYFTSYGALKLCSLEYSAISWDKDKDTGIQRVYKGNVRPGRFVAPEVTAGQPFDPFKADMYSYGVTLYYSILKKYPYESSRSETYEKQWTDANYELNVFIKATAVDLLHNCTEINPSKRYEIQSAVMHPFVASSL